MDWTKELEFGHPVIDRQHREIAALTASLRGLFKNNQQALQLVAALTEYFRLISDHIAAHAASHSDMVAFVRQAIEDLSAGQATTAIVAEFPAVFQKLHRNIVTDDAELSRLLIAEHILVPERP